MKKAFLLGAMVCALGMMTACKSGTADKSATDSTYSNAATENRIYDIVKHGDTLLVVCDPEGLFFGQPLAECVSTEWIKAAYPEPYFKTMTDHEMFPHEDGVCTCGPETFWVVSRNDTLCFQIAESDTISAEKWYYTCGQIRDTLLDFGDLKVGMSIKRVASRLHLSDTIDMQGFKVIHLAAPDLFSEPVYEKQEWGGLKVIDQTNPYTFHYYDVPRIGYAGVELLIERGEVVAINTGWYMAGSREVVWGV